MAPTCTNCNGTDFVWANELKTGGLSGSGTLSLRGRGEIPLGTRICRTCGHAELFLRDISILHQQHLWRPGEFIPIISKTAAKTATHHAPHAHPTAPAPPPPPPEPTPMVAAPIAPAPPPPAPPAPDPPMIQTPLELAPPVEAPEMRLEPEGMPMMAASTMDSPNDAAEMAEAPKAKPTRKRSAKSKA